MLEYLFFNLVFASKFAHFLESKNLTFEQKEESIQKATLIRLSDDLDDDVWDEIDELYDDLAIQDQQLIQQTLQDDSKQAAAGIYIQLEGDKQTIAKVDPDTMNRMLEVISMDELNDFIEAVVSSVEHPDDGPMCEKLVS